MKLLQHYLRNPSRATCTVTSKYKVCNRSERYLQITVGDNQALEAFSLMGNQLPAKPATTNASVGKPDSSNKDPARAGGWSAPARRSNEYLVRMTMYAFYFIVPSTRKNTSFNVPSTRKNTS